MPRVYVILTPKPFHPEQNGFSAIHVLQLAKALDQSRSTPIAIADDTLIELVLSEIQINPPRNQFGNVINFSVFKP